MPDAVLDPSHVTLPSASSQHARLRVGSRSQVRTPKHREAESPGQGHTAHLRVASEGGRRGEVSEPAGCPHRAVDRPPHPHFPTDVIAPGTRAGAAPTPVGTPARAPTTTIGGPHSLPPPVLSTVTNTPPLRGVLSALRGAS